ncbi:MAG: recombinase [Betaproteobacteria bacterium]|nr:recombinase [Betaproteobacteria bacterium]
MRGTVRELFSRWRGSAYTQHQLDALLDSIVRTATPDQKKAWLIELFVWIRGGAGLLEFDAGERAAKRAVRVRFLVLRLQRTPEAAVQILALLAAVLRGCDPVDLLAEGGLPHSDSLWQELKERLLRRWLPSGTASRSLLTLFGQLFPEREDAGWLAALDEDTLTGLHALLSGAADGDFASWFAASCEDSLRYLIAQVRATGLATPVRLRIDRAFRELPFLPLEMSLGRVLEACTAGDRPELIPRLNLFRGRLDECRAVVRDAYAHLDRYGVNTHVVFQLSCLALQLDRIELLVELLVRGSEDGKLALALIIELVRGQEEARSVAGFFRQTTALLAKRLVERNAETGEHYIARDRAAFLRMFRSAALGGALTGMTTTLKFAIGALHLPRLAEGLLASCNYAGSFVLMQFVGATLATKQPSATATVLAASMTDLSSPERIDELVEEIVCLVRSQFAAIAGNLLLVIPSVLLIDLLWTTSTGAHQLDAKKAGATIASLSVFGPTLLYAAFTGVLLWVSSLAAGWADNWFASRQIGENMLTNRRWLIVLGVRRLGGVVKFLHHHIAGLGGNVALGLLLALLPAYADSLGIPFDVRHVTLSTGSITAAAAALGTDVLATGAFWHAVIGIAGIGILNLGVSFGLALQVALRARSVQRVEKHVIYQRLRHIVFRQPRRLVWPDPAPRRASLDDSPHDAARRIRRPSPRPRPGGSVPSPRSAE